MERINMKFTKRQIDLLKKQEIVVLSTVDANNYPRAIFVVPSRVEEERIIISDVKMEITIGNVLDNKNVFIAAFDKEFEYLLKIKGVANYQTSGDLFDDIYKFETNRGYIPKGIITVDITDVAEVIEDD
ncbi:MAG: pyridoxamine 5'-phosphate oxidase family protein [Alphaproteobacteria bacterium]|nr:pyridoxamine 5'-phosphate oxidase family protein [Alphaproteobacteria bacterium]